MNVASRHRLLLAALASAALAPSCFWLKTQRWPAPMEGPTGADLPPDPHPHLPGPEEATVFRHADPVQFRPAGALAGYPLVFFDKKVRATAGACVIVSAGGRAEVLWPSGASVVLFGQAVGWIGSPGRGEPLFDFQDVDRATIELEAGDHVRLLGGALLFGDSGPYLVERKRADILILRNQAKAPVTLSYRDTVYELAPGQTVDLPVVSTGTAPEEPPDDTRVLAGPGFQVEGSGALAKDEDQDALRLRAGGPAILDGLGVRVTLAAGEAATFKNLGAEDSAPEAAPTGTPGSASDTPQANGAAPGDAPTGTPPETPAEGGG
ncbi:MAG: hypothetical protein L6Q99_07950 [Planctomycetes bacterium]|nr:hypothetical protein [Planctomycetota bacterium]